MSISDCEELRKKTVEFQNFLVDLTKKLLKSRDPKKKNKELIKFILALSGDVNKLIEELCDDT